MGTNLLDAELVKRVQAGDTAAFDVLVQKYQHKVINLVGRFVSDHAECQDIAQDAFIKSFRAINSFRGDSQFYTWLYRIAANTANLEKCTIQDDAPFTPATGHLMMVGGEYDDAARLFQKVADECLDVDFAAEAQRWAGFAFREKGDFLETLRVAAKVRPDASTVYLICDSTPTAQINLTNCRAALASSPP